MEASIYSLGRQRRNGISTAEMVTSLAPIDHRLREPSQTPAKKCLVKVGPEGPPGQVGRPEGSGNLVLAPLVPLLRELAGTWAFSSLVRILIIIVLFLLGFSPLLAFGGISPIFIFMHLPIYS